MKISVPILSKIISHFVVFLFIIIAFTSCMTANKVINNYDASLAQKLGADERGMKSYVLVILKTGERKIEDKTLRDSLFRGHFANINKLANEGKLTVAGPFEKNANNYRGLFILNVKTFEEAHILLQNDPTVTSGIFNIEMYEWYGSAALPVYLDTHKKIEKQNIAK